MQLHIPQNSLTKYIQVLPALRLPQHQYNKQLPIIFQHSTACCIFLPKPPMLYLPTQLYFAQQPRRVVLPNIQVFDLLSVTSLGCKSLGIGQNSSCEQRSRTELASASAGTIDLMHHPSCPMSPFVQPNVSLLQPNWSYCHSWKGNIMLKSCNGHTKCKRIFSFST